MSSQDRESEFYAALADHYDDLFGCSEAVVRFLLEEKADAALPVLDVACGTGACTRALLARGVDAHATDLSSAMITRARTLARETGHDPARFSVGSMSDIGSHPRAPFALVFCIGNSIAHLRDHDEVSDFLGAAHDAVDGPAHDAEGSGALVLQYVAADALPVGETLELSTLESIGVSMARRYHREDEASIRFDATLEVEPDGAAQAIELSQHLLVIRTEELRVRLTGAGFREVAMFGGFDRSPVEAGTGVRVLTAR